MWGSGINTSNKLIKKTFMTNNNTYISKNVIEKGASVSKNFLNELEIENIKQLLKNFKKEKR